MTRVCYIITRLNVGGTARQAVALTKHFRNSHLIYGSLAEGEVLLPEAKSLSVGQITKIERMSRPVRPVADYLALRRITAKLKRLRPQIVHTHTSKAGLLGRLAAIKAGVPVIVHTFHGHAFHGYFSRPVARAILEIERRLARRTDALVVLSSSQLAEFSGKYRFPEMSRFHVVPLGLDLEQFEKLPPRGKLRKELGIPDDAFTVGFVGRLEPVKQPEIFIEIISRLDDIHGVFVGGGTLEKRLRRRVEKRGLAGRIHFAGWRENLPEVYADLDAAALTSANEGTPVALIEAAACSLPVAAFAVGGVDGVVCDPGFTDCSGRGQNGFLVRPGNVGEMADRTRRLSESTDLCRRLGEAGRDFVLKKFSFDRRVIDLTRLYDSLTANPGTITK